MPQDAVTRREHALPLQTRAAQLEPTTFNEAEGTVDVVWTTGIRRRCYDYFNDTAFDEELLVTPAAVDMTRFETGVVQVLDGHDRYSGVRAILGIAIRGSIVKGEGRATLKLSQRAELAGVVGDIRAGIIRAISFGYVVKRYEITPASMREDGVNLPLYRAVAWQPQEISFVPVPADANTGTRSQSAQGGGELCEFILSQQERTMHQLENQTQQPEDVAEIRATVLRHGLPEAFATELLGRQLPKDKAFAQILERLAREDDATGGRRNVNARTQLPEAEAQRALMIDALAIRMGCPAMSKDPNPFRHARVVDLARDCLEQRSVRTTNMSPSQLIERVMHTTSDFPELLQGAGERVLRKAYSGYAGGLKRIARKSTARDFRDKQRLMLGEAPTLIKVNEAGEYKYGTMAEAKSSYALGTYGRIFSISRKALVNDDLDAFADMAGRLGRAAAEFEATFLVTLLTSNPVMEDTVALFHANHGNLGTGAGSALQSSSLVTARKAMRLQKGLDSITPIDATAKYLIVPAALEQTAEQLLATITPATVADVNPFAGRLELVVDPRLDAYSATAWYLAADPDAIDALEYAYLEGAEGPQIFTREGFEIDGMEWRVREDFGAGALDWRGLYKANGA